MKSGFLSVLFATIGMQFLLFSGSPGQAVPEVEAAQVMGSSEVCYGPDTGMVNVCSDNCGWASIQKYKIKLGGDKRATATMCTTVAYCTAVKSLLTEACSDGS